MKRVFSVLTLLVLGCGTVVNVPKTDRAAIGWTHNGFKYCLEPAPVDRGAGPMVLGYPPPARDGEPPSAAGTQNYGVAQVDARGARGREIAEITLFARESLYRLCEARRNGDLSEEQALEERKQIMNLLRCLVATQSAHSEVALQTCVLGNGSAPAPAPAAPSSDREMPK